MCEKPILFSTEMVRAILDGRKCQTRRVIKPQPPDKAGKIVMLGVDELSPGFITETTLVAAGSDWGLKAPWQPGDVLWVRETWGILNLDYHPINVGNPNYPVIYVYKADHITGNDGPERIKWRPSIHMPKSAARIWLEVTNVRVERVQEITAHECILEGISSEDVLYNTPVSGDFAQYTINQFKNLWNSINAKRGYGWDSNPWVWVISFERRVG